MKNKIILMLLTILIFAFPAYADRSLATIKGFNATQLIKRGDAKVYRISFIATSNGGSFSLHDVSADGSVVMSDGSTTIKTEGMEATANNSESYDFSDKPLEFSTGLYLRIASGTIVIEYE